MWMPCMAIQAMKFVVVSETSDEARNYKYQSNLISSVLALLPKHPRWAFIFSVQVL